MKYIIILIAALAAVYTGCGENLLAPDNEIIVYQKDSLILYSSDSVKFKGLFPSEIGCGLTVPNYFKITFNALTNDSTNAAILEYGIISSRCQHPPEQQIHLDVTKHGQEINNSYKHTIQINRTDNYAAIPLFYIAFDTNYYVINKYIKLYNITLSRFPVN